MQNTTNGNTSYSRKVYGKEDSYEVNFVTIGLRNISQNCNGISIFLQVYRSHGHVIQKYQNQSQTMPKCETEIKLQKIIKKILNLQRLKFKGSRLSLCFLE